MLAPIESNQEKKVKLAQDGKLVLITAPRLQRYGNAKGLELHEVSVIVGCEGGKEEIR